MGHNTGVLRGKHTADGADLVQYSMLSVRGMPVETGTVRENGGDCRVFATLATAPLLHPQHGANLLNWQSMCGALALGGGRRARAILAPLGREQI